MNLNLDHDTGLLLFAITIFPWLFVHIAFAFAVGYDAGRLPGRRKPVLVGTWIWFFTVLIGGPFLAVAYWAMHHSMVSPLVYIDCTRQRKPDDSF